MNTEVTVELLRQLPAIITALGVLGSVVIGYLTWLRAGVIHTAVNSNYEAMVAKVDEGKAEIAILKSIIAVDNAVITNAKK